MSLINLEEILHLTKGKPSAIPAFNCYNMETIMGVIAAAEESNAPVIIQGYSRLFDSDIGFYLVELAKAAAKRATVPVCIHLDHGAGRKEMVRAIRYGCTGIMCDFSALPFEENIKNTLEAAEICSEAGIPLEGELGHIGLAKDGVSPEHTKVDEAVDFCKATRVAALAVLVGTAHGHYKKTPVLNIDRIHEIADSTNTPLVLHGGSGVPDDQIQHAIAAGIRKINFGTDICCSFLNEVFNTSRDIIAIDLFMQQPVQAVKLYAASKIKLLNADDLCSNKRIYR